MWELYNFYKIVFVNMSGILKKNVKIQKNKNKINEIYFVMWVKWI